MIGEVHHCLLRKLHVGQEATFRIRHRTADWFKIGIGVCWGCYCHLAYLSICRVHYTEPWAGIKTAGRNINNLKYADDTTLMAESKEELMSLLMRLKEQREKAGLKVSIQKIKTKAFGPITSW